MRTVTLSLAVAAVALLAGGCPPENYATIVGGYTRADIDKIISDTTKEPPEIRAELEALGLPSPVIDALLRDKTLANQGGGDLRSAYAKIVEPAFLELTPDEIQIYNTIANQADSTLQTTVADADALAITQFFDTYDLNSATDLEDYLDAGGSVWETIPDGVLTGLFIDFDPDLVIPYMR